MRGVKRYINRDILLGVEKFVIGWRWGVIVVRGGVPARDDMVWIRFDDDVVVVLA
jgi:hypothetical protein